MAVTEFCIAPAGSGKSFRRCAHFLATEFLPHSSSTIFTNFPINVDKMVAFVLERHPDMVESVLRDRIHLIPKEELDLWRTEQSGPWEYFHDKDLDGGRIAIDEIHNFVSTASSKDYVQKWRLFLGEIRHRGCEFECLSQTETKVAKAIRDEAGLRRSLFNSEDRVDPFFKIRQEDWLNIQAGFTGKYIATVFEFDKVIIDGKWKEIKVSRFKLDPKFFGLYDSYSTPIAGGTKSKGKVRPYQTLSLPALFWWFFRRNWSQLIPRLFVVFLVFWITIGGGTPFLITHFMTLTASFQHKKQEAPAPAPVDAAAVSVPDRLPVQVEARPLVVVSPSSSAPVVKPSDDSKLLSEISTLNARIEALNSENAKLSSELKAVRDDLAVKEKALDVSGQLLGLTASDAIFRSGETVHVGSIVRSGKYANRQLVKVDSRNRFAVLGDGTVLYLSN